MSLGGHELRSRAARGSRGNIALLVGCLAFSFAAASPAAAFRLPSNFNQSAAIGGSDGRYFTGSPSDRYTCKVCHASTGTPRIQVSGLPIEGYIPGQTYAIVIDWDDALPSVAYNLEMTNAAGDAFGTFSTPPIEELSPAELCSDRAGAVIMPGTERTLAILTECGAHQSTIRWTAPAASVDAMGRLAAPEAWFSGSLLVADKDGSILGDAVIDLSRVLGPAGQEVPVVTKIHGDCSVSAIAPRSAFGFAGVVWITAGICWLRRGRRRVS